MSPAVLLDEIEASESEGNDDRIEGLLCGAVKQLKMNRAKPDITLYLSLMFLAKIKPNVFATEGIIEVIFLFDIVSAWQRNPPQLEPYRCLNLTGFLSLSTCLAFVKRPCAASCAGMPRSTLKPKGTALCLFSLAIC